MSIEGNQVYGRSHHFMFEMSAASSKSRKRVDADATRQRQDSLFMVSF